MCNLEENAGGVLKPALGIGVTLGHDVVGHHYNIHSLSRSDEVVY